METVFPDPLRTVMSPERVRTSRSTGPLTWNERSNVPTTEAKPASELTSTNNSVRTACWRMIDGLFITERLHRCHFSCPLRRIHAGGQGDQRKSEYRSDNGN